MKLILVLASLVVVIAAQQRQSSFSRRFSGRNDSPEDRFDDSNEIFFRSGRRQFDSRDDSRENSFRHKSGIGRNSLDDSRENFGIGGFRSNLGRRRDSPEDSFEISNRKTFRSNFVTNRDSPEDSFEIRNRKTFRSNFGTRRDSPEDSFEIRNKNTFRSNFGTRRDSPEDSFEVRNRNTFRSHFGTRRDSPEDSFEIRNRNSFRSHFGTSNRRRFDDSRSDEHIARRKQSFRKTTNNRHQNTFRSSNTGFGSSKPSFNTQNQTPNRFRGNNNVFNRFNNSPNKFTQSRNTFKRLDDSVENVFRRKNLFKNPAISFGSGRNDLSRKVTGTKHPFGINRNFVRFDDSDETVEVSRNTFRGRTNTQRFKPSVNRFVDSPEDIHDRSLNDIFDSPEDHFGRNVNTFRSGISNNFIDDDSDEHVFTSLFNKPRVSPQQQRTSSHFSNRNVFKQGRVLPKSNFGPNVFSGVSTPGNFHFSTPIGQRRTVLPKPPVKKVQPKKSTGSFNFNTQFGKPLKKAKPFKKGRTSFNEIRSNPFSSAKKSGITGFKWPGDNVSGYYVSMSTNNRPATSYFVKLDD